MTIINLQIDKRDRPRLVDYYASANWSLFYECLTTHSLTTFRLGNHLFTLRRDISTDISLSMREVELAGDARAFGAVKYGGVGGWRDVTEDEHLQSAARHFDAWLRDDNAKDPESGVPHEGHFLARAARVMEMRSAGGGE